MVGAISHCAGMTKLAYSLDVKDKIGNFTDECAHALADGGTSDNTCLVSHGVDHMAWSVNCCGLDELTSACAAGTYRELGDTTAYEDRSLVDSRCGDTSVALAMGVHGCMTVSNHN